MNAIRILGEFLAGEPVGAIDKPTHVLSDPVASAVWRLIHAPPATSESMGADQAVLLRQAIRWIGGSFETNRRIHDLFSPSLLERAGVTTDANCFLVAEPFRPKWLSQVDRIPAEGVDAPPILRRNYSGEVAETCVHRLGYRRWHTAAQKEAFWCATTTPPGGTSLVVLPTGMGKSLCFQYLAAAGSGLTLVIVPTVALAIDHYHSAREILGEGFPACNPMYFVSGDADHDANDVVLAIRERRTKLLFASPEACVSGRLRDELNAAAQQRWLENLVVDEAHLIESWGAFFRVDFQVLSGLRQKWRDSTGGRLRTLLLSATITPACRKLLEELFSAGGSEWNAFAFQQLRPEMTYFDRSFSSEADRRSAVLECIWRLPRPAIVYTTEVQDARDLAAIFRDEGFQRLGCFHGETRAVERRRLLDEWRSDRLDLMVATSAFGLGVDKPDVRAVVHACLPENINRYYQEVGRGGRDGASSTCILLATDQDHKTAANLGAKLMTTDLIEKRWRSMWDDAEIVDGDENDRRWKVCVHSKRLGLIGVSTWSHNIDWNRRLLVQLARARMIDIVDTEYRREESNPDSERTQWVEIRLRVPPDERSIARDLGPIRDEELREMRQGLEQMEAHLAGNRCISRVLKSAYGRATERLCGGCRHCRNRGLLASTSPVVEIEPIVASVPRVEVVQHVPSPTSATGDLVEIFRRCVDDFGIRQFAIGTTWRPRLLRALETIDLYRLLLLRVDDLDSPSGFTVKQDATVVILHVGQVHEAGAKFRQGNCVVHFLCGGAVSEQLRHRLPTGVASHDVFASTPAWFASLENRRTSHVDS